MLNTYIMRDFSGYRPNLLLLCKSHQISQIQKEVHKVNLLHLFWSIFGTFGSKILEYLMQHCGQMGRILH